MSETVIYHESFFQDGAVFEFLPSWYRDFLDKNQPIDVLEVFKFDKVAAEDFLQNVLDGDTCSIEASQDNRRQLMRLYFNHSNQLKAEGKTTTALGYPFYFERTERATLYLPLFFFPLSVSSEISEQERFTLQPTGQCILNTNLAAYLQARYGVDFTQVKKLIADGKPNSEIIESTGALLAVHMHIDFVYSGNKIYPLATTESINGEGQDKALFFHAAAAQMPLPTTPKVGFSPNTAVTKDTPSVFLQGLYPTDVSQRHALVGNQQPLHIVTGQSGTGKSISAFNLLTHALSEGKKTLVVSSRLKSLIGIQETLGKWNLEKYAFIIKDLQADLSVLLNISRAIGTGIEEKQAKNFDTKAFQLATSQLRQKYNKLFTSYTTLQRDLGIAKDWQTLVGNWLRANAIESREVLNVQLDAKAYSFDAAEYQQLKADVETAEPLFRAIKSIDHELSNLHPLLFTESSKEQSAAHVQQTLATFITRLGHLHREHLFALERFRQQQRAIYQVRYGNMSAFVDKISSQTEAGNKLYGDSFQSSGLWSSFISLFSARMRKIRKMQTDLRADYEVLVKSHVQHRSFIFDFPTSAPSKPSRIAKIVKDFSNKLNTWNNAVDLQVEREVQGLKAGSNLADDNVNTLEASFESLIADINAANIYEKPIERITTNIADNRLLTQKIREQIERTEQHFEEFDSYYDWKRFWLNSDSKSHGVIEGLIHSKAQDWPIALDSWYYHWVLQATYQSTMPQSTDTREDILANAEILDSMLPTQIEEISHERRLTAMRSNRKRRLFDKNNINAYTSFAQLFENEHQTLTEFFPVLLATPDVAAQIFEQNTFDYIIFDDAQHIVAEQCAALMKQGKQVFVFGNSLNLHQKRDSLLYQVLESPTQSTNELGIIHTTQSGAMNAFLDAIYPSEALRLPVLADVKYFERFDVLGRFDEEQNTNTTEAERVLMLLNQVQKVGNRYPTVGIITTTLAQRDLILNMLLKIKQKRSVGYEKIQHLERNNFGVYHWSECSGLRFDIGIVSFVYGIKDTKGKLTKEIQFLNDDNGLEHLFAMISRSSQHLYWCNSVPHNYFDEFLESPYAQGTYVLSSLIRYFQALDSNEQQQANLLLYNVAYAVGATRMHEQNPLLEEISQYLQRIIREERIVFAPAIGSLTVPLMIKPIHEGQPTLILRLDGTFTLPYTPDVVWEQDFVAKMQAQGNDVLETWSVNWWRNPHTETERLAAAIWANDAAYEPKSEPEIVVEEEIVENTAATIDTEDTVIATNNPDIEALFEDAQQVTDHDSFDETRPKSTEV